MEEKKTISGVVAIREFFQLPAAEAMKEIKALKAAGGTYYDWFAAECAKALGKELEGKPAA